MAAYSVGGGLYSTASHYAKFERMLLGGGELGHQRILQSQTVAQMTRNQISDLTLPEMSSLIPQYAKDPIRVPGSLDKFGLGFATNTKPVEGRRSRGSLAWAGIYNTFFWIDPPRKTSVIMMQILPFSDQAAISEVEHFERVVFAHPAEAVASGRRNLFLQIAECLWWFCRVCERKTDDHCRPLQCAFAAEGSAPRTIILPFIVG